MQNKFFIYRDTKMGTKLFIKNVDEFDFSDNWFQIDCMISEKKNTIDEMKDKSIPNVNLTELNKV